MHCFTTVRLHFTSLVLKLLNAGDEGACRESRLNYRKAGPKPRFDPSSIGYFFVVGIFDSIF
jgi:hypothetical protein